MSDVPRSLQSWVSTIQSVVLTADVFQFFIKLLLWVLGVKQCQVLGSRRHTVFSGKGRRGLTGWRVTWDISSIITIDVNGGVTIACDDRHDYAHERECSKCRRKAFLVKWKPFRRTGGHARLTGEELGVAFFIKKKRNIVVTYSRLRKIQLVGYFRVARN